MIRRSRRKMTWLIAEDSNGSYSVWKGNRPVATGLNSIENAKSLVRRTRQPGERVWFVEDDGYRTEMTKQFADRNELVS